MSKSPESRPKALTGWGIVDNGLNDGSVSQSTRHCCTHITTDELLVEHDKASDCETVELGTAGNELEVRLNGSADSRTAIQLVRADLTSDKHLCFDLDKLGNEFWVIGWEAAKADKSRHGFLFAPFLH